MSSSQKSDRLAGSNFDSAVSEFPPEEQNFLTSDLQEPLLETEPAKLAPVVKKEAPPVQNPAKKTEKKKSPAKERRERQINGRIQKLNSKSHPLDKTGCIGAILFSWVKPFIWIGNRTPFE